MRPLDEEDVAGFAKRESLEEVVCAIAFCAALSVATTESLFTAADSDLILIVGRAKGWSWTTVEAVLRLRAAGPVPAEQEARLAAAYQDIEPRSAERVLRVLRRRDHREAA
jgi:hypothetical protein